VVDGQIGHLEAEGQEIDDQDEKKGDSICGVDLPPAVCQRLFDRFAEEEIHGLESREINLKTAVSMKISCGMADVTGIHPHPNPSDGTTNHSTRQAKDASQVAGYPTRGLRFSAG
jgi:hypothetical protein